MKILAPQIEYNSANLEDDGSGALQQVPGTDGSGDAADITTDPFTGILNGATDVQTALDTVDGVTGTDIPVSGFTGLLTGVTEVQSALDTVDAMNVGGVVEYADSAAWEAEDRTGDPEIIDFVEQNGFYEYEPTYTDLRDGEIILDPTTGSGRGILSTPHFDGLWAYLSPDIQETLPTAQATLAFSVGATSFQTLTVTVSGAEVGDHVTLGLPTNLLTSNLVLASYAVTADDTVSIRMYNPTGSTVTPGSTTYSVLVTKRNVLPAITNRGVKIFTLLISETYTSGTLQTDLLIAANEADFRLMINSTWRRKALLADLAVKAIIQGSVLANSAMEDIEGIGY